MTKKILSAFLLCALLLTLFAGCGAKEVQGLPELSPSSLAAPVPAGSTKKIADALASIDPEQVVFPSNTAVPSNVDFITNANNALYDDGYLYVLSNSDVMILSARGGRLELLSSTNFASERSDAGENYEYSCAFYVEGDRLAVVTNQAIVGQDGMNTGSARTFAKIYDISDRTAPVQLADMGQDGVYQDSALLNGELYLISVTSFQLDTENLTLPMVRDNGADVAIAESRIYLCEKPSNVAYTIVSAFDVADGKRADVCAFTDSNLYTSIAEGGIFLARSVSLSAQSDSREEEPYTVTAYATSVVTEIKKLSVGGSLSLLNSYNVEGQLLAIDAKGNNVRLITALARSEYEIYTDEKYGWSNRLDGQLARKNLLWVLGENMQPLLQSASILPEQTLGAIKFSGDDCYITMQDADAPLLRVDLSDPAKAKADKLGGLSEGTNYLLPTDGALLDLSTSDGRIFLSRLDGSDFADTYKVNSFSDRGFVAACSDDASTALVAFDGTAYLLKLGDRIAEAGAPDISVHSGTSFLFEDGYLYACAPDLIYAVDLETAEISAQLAFGLG